MTQQKLAHLASMHIEIKFTYDATCGFFWLYGYICYNLNDFNLFDLQCLEKINDQTTNEYLKSSNKGPKTIEQINFRRLRMGHIMNQSMNSIWT
ncbi:hypothetical protein BpHYR1_006068 [Brachionus plicatilis]|uniref:Uncharacterized protein n=1 Tax=Brachionus plicatilis TaxID=10195 RepID=A0A3M7RD06_BRAPC|nr:hypothetical protein BpHYR1_006068 [Brachionus plicatilis]